MTSLEEEEFGRLQRQAKRKGQTYTHTYDLGCARNTNFVMGPPRLWLWYFSFFIYLFDKLFY